MCPGEEEGRDGVGEDESPACARDEHCRDEPDALVAEHVAALRENRYDERGEERLGCFEPVAVGVTDVKVFHQVAGR